MAEESLLLPLLGRQIEEIQTHPDRALAYATLLHLLRRSADDPSAMEALAASVPALLGLLLAGIHRDDEEIAAQALKCLGFVLYHPSLVAVISGDTAKLLLESLVKLILTTPMKAICNLGVWCITVQQLGAQVVEAFLEPLTGAVVYALDNPFGSLSTTFEAAQAATKLSTCFCMKMKGMSHIWVPPVYRRLISNDKKERDMAERCLLKTKSIICPPSPRLYKEMISDLEQNIHRAMMEMSHDRAQMVLMIRAWGWYVCLLGSEALNNRHLLNKMLKIPELTFGNPDRQVQVASVVAWKSLVDVLISPQIVRQCRNTIHSVIQQTGVAESPISWISHDDQIKSALKRIKTLLIPLQGIISTECHISVHLSFLDTWLFLLHKLDILINHPSVIAATFWPVLEVIFSRGPDDKNLYLWTSCLNLLHEFVLSKVPAGELVLTGKRHSSFPIKVHPLTGCYGSSKACLNDYPINWLPWDISDLGFLLNMIASIISPKRIEVLTLEFRSQTINAALKIFRSVLKAFQIEVERLSTSHDKVQSCTDVIFKFTKEVYEAVAVNLNESQFNDMGGLHLQFIEVLRDELDPSIILSSAISNWITSKDMNNS